MTAVGVLSRIPRPILARAGARAWRGSSGVWVRRAGADPTPAVPLKWPPLLVWMMTTLGCPCKDTITTEGRGRHNHLLSNGADPHRQVLITRRRRASGEEKTNTEVKHRPVWNYDQINIMRSCNRMAERIHFSACRCTNISGRATKKHTDTGR